MPPPAVLFSLITWSFISDTSGETTIVTRPADTSAGTW